MGRACPSAPHEFGYIGYEGIFVLFPVDMDTVLVHEFGPLRPT